MARNGTLCGCPHVNRLYNCKEDEIKLYIPKNILDNKDLISKALK